MVGDINTWNICGLKSKRSPFYNEKIDTLSSLLENVNSTNILNIQETHIAKNEELPSVISLYKHLYNFEITNATDTDTYSGIILCIRKTERLISSEILEAGRLMLATIQNEASKVITNIFSIYCKSSDSEKQKNADL